MARNDQDQIKPDSKTAPDELAQSIKEQRKSERKEAEEMQERGTLTPEDRKQGVTSHLPESETAFMYRSEEDRDEKNAEKEKL